MITVFAIIHIILGLCLVLFVLLQDPKGGAMGVFSGGSSANSFFGASGASNFLTSTTKWLAILFAVSCLGLTYMTAKRGSSVMDSYAPPAGANVPVGATVPAGTDPAAAPAGETAPAAQPTSPTEEKPK